jgi:ABC-type Fe3+-hydroxamate transport system substrate-binding protein
MTARDDIETLANALEEEAAEARQVAEDREARAQALREFAGEKDQAPAMPSFTTTQGER